MVQQKLRIFLLSCTPVPHVPDMDGVERATAAEQRRLYAISQFQRGQLLVAATRGRFRSCDRTRPNDPIDTP